MALALEGDEGTQVFNQGVFAFDHERRVAIPPRIGNHRCQASSIQGRGGQCKRMNASGLARAKESKDRFDNEQRTTL